MAEHTPPLESGQLLSPDLPLLTPPPSQPPPSMVNGDGSQQVGIPGSDCLQLRLMVQFAFRRQIRFSFLIKVELPIFT